MASSPALDPIYFGKLPTRGDFVRSGANRPSVRALDNWFQRGLHTLKSRQPLASQSVAGAPPCCFVFSPREVPGALIGVMQMSRDQSGRRYPFLIALDAGGRHVEACRLARAPVQLGAFFGQAHALLQRVVEGQISPRDIPGRLETVRLPAGSSDPAPARDYERYLHQTTLEEVWEALWVHPNAGRDRRLLKKLIEALLPFRECSVPARLSYGLQFPLVAGDWAGSCLTSFWWETCFRLLGFPDVTPTCFWTASSNVPGCPPSLLFFLRPPPAGAFVPLFAGEPESDAIYPLDGTPLPTGAAPAPPELPTPYESLLDGKKLTLWDFLHRL